MERPLTSPERGFFVPLLLIIIQCSITAASDFSFFISQNGLDQIGEFTMKQGFSLIEQNPLAVNIKSTDADHVNQMGNVDLANILGLDGLRFKLEQDKLTVFVYNFSLKSEANITAEIWPLPVTEETVQVNVFIPQGSIGLVPVGGRKVNDLKSLKQKGAQSDVLQMQVISCDFSQATIESTTKNYWLFATSARLSGSLMQSNFAGLVCPQVAGIVNNLQTATSKDMPMGDYIPDIEMPPGMLTKIKKTALHYNLAGLDVNDGVLVAQIELGWKYDGKLVQVPDREGSSAETEGTGELSNVQLRLNDITEDRHHFSVWIEQQFIAEFLTLVDWNIMFLNESVPVTSEHIPIRSRKFLTTMCDICFFWLRVWVTEQPDFSADNGTINLLLNFNITMFVVNPVSKSNSIFMQFGLGFDIDIRPSIENGTFKATLHLNNASVLLENSAFPEEWAFFMEDLVEGMLKDLIWPEIKDQVEQITNVVGIGLSDNCGLDPDSAQIHLVDGQMGFSADLSLSQFDQVACMTDFATAVENAIPKNATAAAG